MAANTSPIFPLTVQNYAITFAAADGTTVKTLYEAGLYGSRVDSVGITSSDTAARVFRIYLSDGTTNYLAGEFSVAAGSGTNGISSALKMLTTAWLSWLDSSGCLFLKAGWSLKIGLKESTITANKLVTFIASGGDY